MSGDALGLLAYRLRLEEPMQPMGQSTRTLRAPKGGAKAAAW